MVVNLSARQPLGVDEGRAAGRRACADLQHQFRATGVLFGPAVERALTAGLEVVQDRFEDAIHEAQDIIEARIGEAVICHEQRNALTRRVSELHDVLVCTALEVQRRYGAIRTEVPDAYRPLIEAGGDLWPFVYPPGEERHEHGTIDGGPECAHPLCLHVEAPAADGEEPF